MRPLVQKYRLSTVQVPLSLHAQAIARLRLAAQICPWLLSCFLLTTSIPKIVPVVVEPRIVSEQDLSHDDTLTAFTNIIVARTLARHASDGSVVVQIANPSTDGVRYDDLCLGRLSTVSAVSPGQVHVKAAANNPVTDEDIRHAKSELEGPMSKAFTNTTLTSEQQTAVLSLCTKHRPVFLLPMLESG